MDAKRTPDRDECLRAALSLLAQRAYTFDELACELGIDPEGLRSHWRSIEGLRRCQGRFLIPDAARGVLDRPFSRSWYVLTWRLGGLLEEFQRNESLAVHYATILAEPEGGHFVLNLAAAEVVCLLRLSCTPFDEERLSGVCVGAYEPTGDVERLTANAGRILLHIEDYRSEPLTLGFVERLYADLVAGVDLADGDCAPAGERGAQELALLCRSLEGCDPATSGVPGQSHHVLLGGLAAFALVASARPFPVGNEVFAYVLYFLVLHRGGYHFSAHVPVVRILQECGFFAMPVPLDECDGFFECTGLFERVVERLVGEQRYIMDKLDGMGRRRARFRAIVDADETMNPRQKDVLLEALLHSNAEFSYAVHERRYNVSYLCARSDLARFLDMGLFRCCDDGVRHFFIADEGFGDRAWDYLRQRCAAEYARFYREDGTLRDEFHSSCEAAEKFNRDVGFYEPSLMEDIWIEHYAHRRQPIVDEDGLWRRDRSHAGAGPVFVDTAEKPAEPQAPGGEPDDPHRKKGPDVLLGTGGEGRTRTWSALRGD